MEADVVRRKSLHLVRNCSRGYIHIVVQYYQAVQNIIIIFPGSFDFNQRYTARGQTHRYRQACTGQSFISE